MKKTLIVAGGTISKELLEEKMKGEQFHNVIAVDKGLEILDLVKIEPTHLIGDFDSVNPEIFAKYQLKNISICTLQAKKDNTDTEMALYLALELGAEKIVILGAIGSRLDHTLANIHIMQAALNKKVDCRMINENNEIFLMNNRMDILKEEKYKYISLIPLTTKVTGVTLNGFEYSLANQTLSIGESLGISNEQIEDSATIEIQEGILIIIKSKD